MGINSVRRLVGHSLRDFNEGRFSGPAVYKRTPEIPAHAVARTVFSRIARRSLRHTVVFAGSYGDILSARQAASSHQRGGQRTALDIMGNLYLIAASSPRVIRLERTKRTCRSIIYRWGFFCTRNRRFSL